MEDSTSPAISNASPKAVWPAVAVPGQGILLRNADHSGDRTESRSPAARAITDTPTGVPVGDRNTADSEQCRSAPRGPGLMVPTTPVPRDRKPGTGRDFRSRWSPNPVPALRAYAPDCGQTVKSTVPTSLWGP